MITACREKLLEAKYFLECIKERQSDRDVFKYNLSAFLAAARSVTFIMQTEFDKVTGFREWYNEKQSNMRNDETMRLLNDKRRITIHTQPIQPRAHIIVNITEYVTISSSISMVITRADGSIEKQESEPTSPPAPAKTDETTEWRWYFDELPEKDVVTLCQEYIVKLETLVAECESRFTS